MFYQIQNSVTLTDFEHFDPDVLTIGLIELNELEHSYPKLGFSEANVLACKNHTHRCHGGMELYQDYLFGILFGINTRQIIKVQDRFGVFIKHNLFLIVIIQDKDQSIQATFTAFLEHINITKINLEKLVFGFFERIISNDYTLLEKIESSIIEYEDRINERKISKDFCYQITEIRKKLLLLDNYYQQLIAFGDELEENSTEIFLSETMPYFGKFNDRVTRLSNHTHMLQEYCVQVRENYHAQMDIDLNVTMRLFTVVTTIFLPLTLIVGWYGMNFTTMPELTWKYGYIYVILLSIAIAVFCILYFKKKKYL